MPPAAPRTATLDSYMRDAMLAHETRGLGKKAGERAAVTSGRAGNTKNENVRCGPRQRKPGSGSWRQRTL